jgi:hypothetical protein
LSRRWWKIIFFIKVLVSALFLSGRKRAVQVFSPLFKDENGGDSDAE